MKNEKASPWKSLRTGLLVLLALIIFAYGFEITDIDLDQLRSEQRQQSLQRVTRALARPDIFEFEQEEQKAMAPVYVPCPADGSTPEIPAPDMSGAYVTVTPACAEPGQDVTVEGFNFFPNASGPVRFVPGSDPANVVELGNLEAQTDAQGHFTATLKLPRRESEDQQFIRATMRQNIGIPRFTETAKITWDKIVETVFLALLATTLGTLLAIPLSFIAARNLMKSVRSPLASIALSIIGWPIGIAIGYFIVSRIGQIASAITSLPINLASVMLAPGIAWFVFRWAMPQEELKVPSLGVRVARLLALFVAVLVSLFWLFQLAQLTGSLSLSIRDSLGPAGFLATFLFQVSNILRVTTPAIGALVTGGALSSLLARMGQQATERGTLASVKVINLLLAAAAGATVFGLLGLLVEWLYQIGRPQYTLWGPIIVGALLGLGLAIFTRAKDTLPIGLVMYTITRTILNTLRSVEAVIMAIVFVIAVGIGPFAGVLALGLHTIVSLAKLYSEQVESIAAGPLEAIQATGANRLQTIIYAVIPQIVPPYISYTMYRWDINVRMSTIIGIVGGGGIGFVLIQNINLLNYRAASAQMIAIAIVVSMMDYISSVMREKFV
jgi:phosphonate ABC transporter permease subunit PhnE